MAIGDRVLRHSSLRSCGCVAFVAAALVLAGCGDGDQQTEVGIGATTVPAQAGAPAQAAAPAEAAAPAQPTPSAPPSAPAAVPAPGGAAAEAAAPAEVAAPAEAAAPAQQAAATSTTKAAEVGVAPAGEEVNDKGDPIRLDETASLACANAEFARDDLRNGNRDGALSSLSAAADRAKPSAVKEISSRAEKMRSALSAADPLAVVEDFLVTCQAKGHLL